MESNTGLGASARGSNGAITTKELGTFRHLGGISDSMEESSTGLDAIAHDGDGTITTKEMGTFRRLGGSGDSKEESGNGPGGTRAVRPQEGVAGTRP